MSPLISCNSAASVGNSSPSPLQSSELTTSKPEPSSDTFAGLERFVDAAVVADFLSIRRDEVLQLTRDGVIRGYPYKGRQRHKYRYHLSEMGVDFAALLHARQSTITAAAPVSRRKKSNG